MKHEVSSAIAAKMQEAIGKMEEAVDYMAENVEFEERAPLTRAIGDIFAIMTDQIYSRLVKDNPSLHDSLFRGLPRSTPQTNRKD